MIGIRVKTGTRVKTTIPIQTRCSHKQVKELFSTLTDDMKVIVKNMRFGNLLKLSCDTLSRKLCEELVMRFEPIKKRLSISSN